MASFRLKKSLIHERKKTLQLMRTRASTVTIAHREDGSVAAVLINPLAIEHFIQENPGQNFEMKDYPVRRD